MSGFLSKCIRTVVFLSACRHGAAAWQLRDTPQLQKGVPNTQLLPFKRVQTVQIQEGDNDDARGLAGRARRLLSWHDLPGKCCPGSCPAPPRCPGPERQARSAAGTTGRAAHHPCIWCIDLELGPADDICGGACCRSWPFPLGASSQHSLQPSRARQRCRRRRNCDDVIEPWLHGNMAQTLCCYLRLAHAERRCCKRTAKRGRCPAGRTAPPS